MAKIALSVCLILLQSVCENAIEPGCENCGCCVDKLCNPGPTDKGYCTNGCIPGLGGLRCYNKCPDDCITCEIQYFRNCSTCSEGKQLMFIEYYLNGQQTQRKACVDCPYCIACNIYSCQCIDGFFGTKEGPPCSQSCPSQCKTCTSATQCQECNLPYYNDGSVTDCSLSACPRNCKCSTSGVCSGCHDGFFDTHNECNIACPANCKTCTDQTTCDTCKEGFYNGTMHDNSNAAEQNDCSLTCRDNCSTCSSYDSCTKCKPGFYGTYCRNKCSVGCMNSICAIADGSCSCRSSFSGPVCTDCIPGRYGDRCHLQCPVDCKNGICNKTKGFCAECKSTNIVGTTCSACAEGYHGMNCETICPKGCLAFGQESECDRESGVCKMCPTGFYGDYCNKSCSDKCSNNQCAKDNGHCIDGCIGNFDGPTCIQELKDSTSIALGGTLGVVLIVIIVLVIVYTINRRFPGKTLTSLLEANEESKNGESSNKPVPIDSSMSDGANVLHEYEHVQGVPNESVYNVPECDNGGTVAVYSETVLVEYENTRIS